MDWNDWIAEVSKMLLHRGIDNNVINRKWSGVRHRYKQGMIPKEVVDWLCSTNHQEFSSTA